MWGNIKLFNKCVAGIPKGEEKKRQKKYFEENLAKNFQKIIKDIKPQIQKTQKHITYRGTKVTITVGF